MQAEIVRHLSWMKQKDLMNHMNKAFVSKVDKTMIPTCEIMGVNLAAINMSWLIEFTKKYIKELSGDCLCVSNVHTTVMSYDDPAYCAVQNGGIMAIPDGGPLSSVGRKRGFADMKRTTGPDYLKEILKISEKEGYRHYFYGSTQKTLDKLSKIIEKKYPGVQVAGMYSPPFRALSTEEDEQIVQIINESHADFVWVGLGAPKQECWMNDHQGKIKGFMVGVGAAFDYEAGNIERAPMWMQRANLEWLYRFLQEPKRLFKRYFYTNTKFIWNAVIRGK